jgi:hypothetical protein
VVSVISSSITPTNSQETMMHTFDTPAPIAAVLDIPAGRVQFIATDRADTTVRVQPADASKSRDVTVAQQTTVDYAQGVLRIQATAKNQYFGASGAIEVTVELPTGSRVEAKTASAEFRTVGRLGEVRYAGSHGPISLDQVGSVHVSSAASDVSVARVEGLAEIRTSKGDIRVGEAVGGAVVLRTDAGDVEIAAAAGVSACLDAGTSYGRIRNSLNNTEGAAAGLSINASTAVGDIVARSL